MPQVKIVSDSTADIVPDEAKRLGISVVPLNLTIDQDHYKDGMDITPREFYQKLPHAKKLPTTSQPSIGAFQDVFRNLTDEGAHVVCITMSAKLSGTYNSARMAAENFASGRVTVVDSTTVTGAEAFFVQTAVEMARLGKSAEQIVAELTDMTGRVQVIAALDTLEYLHKGGRIGAAATLIGGLLNFKPIIQVKDGEVKPLERVRSKNKAVQRIAELVKTGGKLDRLCILHGDSQDEAGELALMLADAFPMKDIHQYSIGPVIGTYAGPRAIGVGLVRAAGG